MKQVRNTSQKKIIRELIAENYTHPTADEIYELARQKDPTISRGTVYRNLNFMSETGGIVRLMMPFGPDRYDCNTYNHYHFLCRKCKKVLDTKLSYAEKLDFENSGIEGCRIEGYKLLLTGLCPDCNNSPTV